MRRFSFSEKLVLFFVVITWLLILIHAANLLLIYVHKLSYSSWYFKLFDMNRENNIPAVFSAFGLLTSSIILLLIAFQERRLKRYNWIILSIIFLFLSSDELFSIHERLNPIRELLHVSGYLFFAWVVPYGIAVIFLIVLFYKFLISLSVTTERLIILSGIFYILGAMGFELISSKQFVSDNEVRTFTYLIITFFEESFEMSAIVLFIYTILDYLSNISEPHNEPAAS